MHILSHTLAARVANLWRRASLFGDFTRRGNAEVEWAACVGLNYRKFLQVGTRKTSQRLQQMGKAESLSSKIKSFHILLSHSTYVQRLENAV